MLFEEQVVGLRPVDASDLVNIAKPASGEQCGLRARALEDGVNGYGTAMQEEPRSLDRRARLVDARHDAFDELTRRRQRLAEQGFSRKRVEGDNIREGTANVGGYTKRLRTGSLFPELLGGCL